VLDLGGGWVQSFSQFPLTNSKKKNTTRMANSKKKNTTHMANSKKKNTTRVANSKKRTRLLNTNQQTIDTPSGNCIRSTNPNEAPSGKRQRTPKRERECKASLTDSPGRPITFVQKVIERLLLGRVTKVFSSRKNLPS